MEKPMRTAEHEKLDKLTGKWIGEEKIEGSPHASEKKATGTFDFRSDLDGLFTIVDYVGQWENDTLMLHQEGSGNTTFEVTDGGLIFKIEMPVEGKGFKPIVEGTYRRAGLEPKCRKRISLNWIA